MLLAKQELRRSHRVSTIGSSKVKQHLIIAELLQYAYTNIQGLAYILVHTAGTGPPSVTLKRDVDYDSDRMEMALPVSAQGVSDPTMLLFARPPALHASSPGFCPILPIFDFALYCVNLSSPNKIAVIYT